MANIAAYPLVSGPISGGAKGWPFGGPSISLADFGYGEEEFFIEGSATRYRLQAGKKQGFDGRWQVEPAGEAPYRTRIVVYRPTDPTRFNGTAVVTWNNVTLGFDLIALGDEELAEIVDSGAALVAITAQQVGITGLPQSSQGLVAWDRERYGELSIESDDYSFDIFTQAARAIGPERPHDGVDPMGGLDVQNVIANGVSQSASLLATYINAIQPLSGAFDGFFIALYFANGQQIEVGDEVTNVLDDDEARERMARLGGDHVLRDDLDVPVFVVNSELESGYCYPARQPDTDLFRYWEVAGTSHSSLQVGRARLPGLERDGVGVSLPEEGINALPMTPVLAAAYHHLQRWVTGGPPPPVQPLIEFAGDPPGIQRDERGIARGGIRLPQAEVPVAQNSSIPLSDDVWSFLRGSNSPFTKDVILALYGDRATYLARFEAAAQAAISAGVLLPRDVPALLAEAGSAWPD